MALTLGAIRAALKAKSPISGGEFVLSLARTVLGYGQQANTNTFLTSLLPSANRLLNTDDMTGRGSAATSVSADTAVAPDGATTADSVTDNATNTTHSASEHGVAATSGSTYTFSAYIKKVPPGIITTAAVYNSAGFAKVDLDSGTITSSGGTGYVSSAISSVGNGWYRVSVTSVAQSSSISLQVFLNDAVAYSGSFGGLYIWGWQFEYGSSATTYSPIGATNTTGPYLVIDGGSLIGQVGDNLSGGNGSRYRIRGQLWIGIARSSDNDLQNVEALAKAVVDAWYTYVPVENVTFDEPVVSTERNPAIVKYTITAEATGC